MRCIAQQKLNIEQVRARNDEMFSYSIYVTERLLKIIGAWPLDADASSLNKFIKYLINVACYLLMLYFFVPSLLYIIFIPKNIRVKLRIVATILTCTGNAIKYTLLLKRSKQLEMCFYSAKKDWQMVESEEDYECMRSRGKDGRALAILSTCFIYSGTTFYRTLMPLAKGKVVVDNITIRPLACPSYYIVFNEQESPAYEFVFLGHFLSGFIVYTIASAVFALTTFFVLHTCGQLEILIRKIKNIETVDSDDDNVKEHVAEIVLYQMKIRSFIKKIVDVVEYMILLEIAACMSLICIILHSFIMEYDNITSALTYTVIIISFTYNLFIFCYIGELLADQQMKVIVASGTLDWHHLSTKSARSLILIILMSNSTSKLTAGKILDLSLSNFASMFKTTIGYCNILRSMTY